VRWTDNSLMTRKRSRAPAFNLAEQFPTLADELLVGLAECGEAQLAQQVAELRVLGRCRCGEEFCGQLYTMPQPRGAWGPGLRNVQVPVATGMVILDVVDGRIGSVEVLFRDEVRARLLELFP
jgi:hypothetical protein